MAILVDRSLRVLIQGITGSTGRSFAERLITSGTSVVAGTSPGHEGETVFGVPVFETVAGAIEQTSANSALAVLGPLRIRDAVLESIEAGLPLIVAYAENVPLHDALAMVDRARTAGCRLLGPNSAGAISPGLASLSDLNPAWLSAGPVGIVSKSGTLTYEVSSALAEAGIGISTIVCLGGDKVIGTSYADVLPAFEADPDTRAVVLVGEPGGILEMAALPAVVAMRTPVVAYFTGVYAPPAKRLGHAGAIALSTATSAVAKANRYRAAGIPVADLLPAVPSLVRAALAD
jgi:succinyl-CoA synthetase alpha subunit